jgi:hypothetical protein
MLAKLEFSHGLSSEVALDIGLEENGKADYQVQLNIELGEGWGALVRNT